MAYVIGSDKGKKIAEDLKTGETYKASDGSTWTKKADGSVSVKTSSGENFDNAYPAKSGGGSSGGNSQYSGVSLGKTYNPNTDYQALINQAVANGDYLTAAQAEQLRNQKIVGEGSPYDLTYNYTQYLVDDIKDKYKQPEFSYDVAKPTTPEKDPRIDKLLNEILNRDDFSYDVANDPLYQQYKQMYQREGDRAMKETLAEAAAGAGGMNTYAVTAAQQANSYYNSQLNDRIPELYQLAYEMYLNDIDLKVQDLGILQDMDATQYNRYRDTMNDWYNDKNFAYGQYQDAVQQGNLDRTFDYNALWDNIGFTNENYWKNKNWNVSEEQREIENSRYDTEWEASEEQRWIENGFTEKELALAEKELALSSSQKAQAQASEASRQSRAIAEAQMRALIENGDMPDDDIIAAAGWKKSSVEKLVYGDEGVPSGGGSSSGGGSGGSSGGSSSNAPSTHADTPTEYTVTNSHGDSFVVVTGYGRLSWDELETMVDKGIIVEKIDKKTGKVSYRKA